MGPSERKTGNEFPASLLSSAENAEDFIIRFTSLLWSKDWCRLSLSLSLSLSVWQKCYLLERSVSSETK